jgi:hypothetical protein
MTDQFNKLADALRSENAGVRACAAMEVESLLRDAAGVDVAGLQWADAPEQTTWGSGMAEAVLSIDKDHTAFIYADRSACAALESALRLVLAQRVPPEAALRELATAKRNLDHESNARNHGSAPEAMLAAMAAKKRFDAAISAVLAAAPQAKEQSK